MSTGKQVQGNLNRELKVEQGKTGTSEFNRISVQESQEPENKEKRQLNNLTLEPSGTESIPLTRN